MQKSKMTGCWSLSPTTCHPGAERTIVSGAIESHSPHWQEEILSLHFVPLQDDKRESVLLQNDNIIEIWVLVILKIDSLKTYWWLIKEPLCGSFICLNLNFLNWIKLNLVSCFKLYISNSNFLFFAPPVYFFACLIGRNILILICY